MRVIYIHHIEVTVCIQDIIPVSNDELHSDLFIKIIKFV